MIALLLAAFVNIDEKDRASAKFALQEEQTVNWKKAGSGILCGVPDGKTGSKLIKNAEEWDAFRKAHPGPEKGSKMAEDYRPLPDFDFQKHDALIIWASNMVRELHIVSVQSYVVQIYERRLFDDEDRVARAVGSATYLLLAIPSGWESGVRWTNEAPVWKNVSHGLLSGTEDMKSGWAHLSDAKAYEEFRKEHVRITSKSKRENKSEPLPDFDFEKQDLVIVWGGTMLRTVEVLAVQNGTVIAQEWCPSYNENEVARMVGAGTYSMIAAPKGKYEVRWTK